MIMKKTNAQLFKEAREKKYKSILKALKPLEKKFGKKELRWALNKWATAEGLKQSLLRKKEEIESQLTELK